MSSTNVKIYLPDGTSMSTNAKSKDTTIADLLNAIGFKPKYAYVVFSGTSSYDYGTPLVNLDLTLDYYNMWHIDVNYTAEFTVYSKEDTNKYNHELYDQYKKNTPTVE